MTKNPVNYYSLKATKFHGDSVRKKSAGTKKLQGAPNGLMEKEGGGLCRGLNIKVSYIAIKSF